MRRVLPERKGCAVDLDHKVSEDLVRTAVWAEDSLRYAREHDQPELAWLLGAVKADVELEGRCSPCRRGSAQRASDAALGRRRPHATTCEVQQILQTTYEGGSANRRRAEPGSPPGKCSWKRNVGS